MPEENKMNDTPPERRSWRSAYFDFLRDKDESRILKLMPLAVLGFGPIDDVLLPVIGLVDDIPTAVVAAGALAATIVRVRNHR